MNKIQCNRCGGVFTEDQLIKAVEHIDDEKNTVCHIPYHPSMKLQPFPIDEVIDACPNCLTDEYLMDMEEE